ncbi:MULTISPECIES: putative RNA methyltransferase [Subtercola]|uniref:23S rRNA (guanine(745)-N(1))-methyltransferase N-terminal domain-containing protein n=1 Tax=Subtercola vilae TaxID=2056433 RepID=A0A4T2C4B2_9MICO|nr:MULTISPECIES: hypothetical protein [Subtercola]MEA9986202.1 methyltransferase type 11 [Subtercola sp. RTI3]TIH38322.1 hypothetical protein D4765_07015 [Subtercola vilae]
MTDALERSLDILACPLCGGSFGTSTFGTSTFGVGSRSLRCENGHAFDIARQGYASLTIGGGPHHHGDTAEMVAARGRHLARGHYAPIADAIAKAFAEHANTSTSTGTGNGPSGWCVELAGGTGYYAAHVLDARPRMHGLTLDVSKNAARAAARTHPRLASATGDVRALLPIASAQVDLVLSIFGPRRGDEVARVLAADGEVIVVTPREAHLAQLRERFALLAIGADKQARLIEAMQPLQPAGTVDLDYVVDLTPADVVDSIMMGPNAFHRERADIEELARALPDTLSTSVAVTISRFRH